jgi:stage II sporulation protein D
MMVGDRTGRPLVGQVPEWIRASQRHGQIEVLGRTASAVRLVPMIGVLKINKREYPGALEILPSGDTLVVINELPLEEYLAGAVKAEAGDKMPMEMLKAQAIVARTYAAYHRQLNASKPYHLVASTAHQQYLGRVAGDSPVWTAVRETEGRTMLLDGALFPAFYHTDSGGHTEDPRVVFGTGNMPPLKPVRVDFASQSAHSEWKLDVPLSDLGAALLKHGISVGRVVALEVLERSSSLRVTYIAVRGLKGTATIRGNDLRKLVGYDTLKSTLFRVVVDGPIARFAGRGYGHGVGLDQWRAKTMADLGYDASQILEYYYPGAVLSSLR